MSDPPGHTHYSYTVYRDPETARTFDERRFGGPIGELIAVTQARVLAGYVGSMGGRRILDVGTGTGRAALIAARGGGAVTAIDASPEMLTVARQRAALEGLSIAFEPGDAQALRFPDHSFDVAISLRVLMHTPDWRASLGELCRVASERVIFDYPSARSAAAVQALGRRLLHAIGARTEPYRVFTDRTVARELRKHGFAVRSAHRQFVLPIAVHKAIGSLRFTNAVEGAAARAGMLRLFGSPVTVLAERCVSS